MYDDLKKNTTEDTLESMRIVANRFLNARYCACYNFHFINVNGNISFVHVISFHKLFKSVLWLFSRDWSCLHYNLYTLNVHFPDDMIIPSPW